MGKFRLVTLILLVLSSVGAFAVEPRVDLDPEVLSRTLNRFKLSQTSSLFCFVNPSRGIYPFVHFDLKRNQVSFGNAIHSYEPENGTITGIYGDNLATLDLKGFGTSIEVVSFPRKVTDWHQSIYTHNSLAYIKTENRTKAWHAATLEAHLCDLNADLDDNRTCNNKRLRATFDCTMLGP